MSNFPKFMNKKFIIGMAAVFVAAIIIAAVYFNFDFFQGSILVLTGSYDIQQDYCGKIIDSHYCQCAFEGESCETIGLDKDGAYNLVMAGYGKWLVEKQKEECLEKGGRWVKDVCRK